MESLKQKIDRAVNFIKEKNETSPQVGIILGSGLGAFVEKMENKTTIPYNQIPHFKKVSVEGHEGKLILGNISGVSTVALQGRFHLYEGHSMEDVVFPVRVLAKLGIKFLILTNAAGGVNQDFSPGDLIILTDHINLSGQNPLVGPNDESMGPRFPDMSRTYSENLIKILEETGKELKIKTKKGVYAGVLGPTYETPSEIKMIRTLGGDVVGMSTVPEAIVANQLGIKICGISCVTNMGAGIIEQTLKHEDIKHEALKVMDRFTNLLTGAILKFHKAAQWK